MAQGSENVPNGATHLDTKESFKMCGYFAEVDSSDKVQPAFLLCAVNECVYIYCRALGNFSFEVVPLWL
jgi:hypothetical protein